MQTAKDLLEIVSVEVVENYCLSIVFSDGITKKVDLSLLIKSAPPVFEPLKNINEFKKISVNPIGGISWDCGADLSADYLKTA